MATITTINNGPPIPKRANAQNCAVLIQNLFKSYKNGSPVLKDFSMSIEKGDIYGLLGASGCGKTTVLSCIVGISSWERGKVLVLGDKPGTVHSGIPGNKIGYMPQDLALYEYLTTEEAVLFFARLYGMSKNKFKNRLHFLRKLLELPENTNKLSELSGGERKRVSLAAALVHTPKLLVLDEPTVGLDPLLRLSIWDHLRDSVKTCQMTILITTHYIEEARAANMIGLLRNGRLIAEDTPSNLLAYNDCKLLEEVVMKLCKNDQGEIENEVQPLVLPEALPEKNCVAQSFDGGASDTLQDNSGLTCSLNPTTKQIPPVQEVLHNILESIRRIYGFTVVLLLCFHRLPMFLILLLCMPTFQGSVSLITCGSKMKNINFGVVNHELANFSEACNFLPSNSCDITYLSRKLLDQLRKDDVFRLNQYDNEQSTLSHVHQGNTWGFLSIGADFSQSTVDLATQKHFASNNAIEGSQVRVRTDDSHYIASYFIKKHLLDSYMNFADKLLVSCEARENSMLPIQHRRSVYGNGDKDYLLFLLPGLITLDIMLMVSGITGVIFAMDYKQATLARVYSTGMSSTEIIASYLLAQVLLAIGQVTIWSLVLYTVFGIIVQGSYITYYVFCVTVGLCGATLGLFLGVIFRSEFEICFVVMFLTHPFCLFGGVLYSLERMSKFWQMFSNFLPVTIPTLSLRYVIVKGLGWSNDTVLIGFFVLVSWTLVMLALTIVMLKKVLSDK